MHVRIDIEQHSSIHGGRQSFESDSSLEEENLVDRHPTSFPRQSIGDKCSVIVVGDKSMCSMWEHKSILRRDRFSNVDMVGNPAQAYFVKGRICVHLSSILKLARLDQGL